MKTEMNFVAGYFAAVEGLAHTAAQKHGPILNIHTGHGLLLEEIDEFWDEVKRKESERDLSKAYLELVDVGVCCIRWAGLYGHTQQCLAAIEDRVEAGLVPVPTLHAAYSMMLHCDRFAIPMAAPDPDTVADVILKSAIDIGTVAAMAAICLVCPRMELLPRGGAQ